MKTKYPSLFGILVALMLVASFVVPTNMISPAPVEADPGICKWDALFTPGYLPLKNDVGSLIGGFAIYNWDIHDMAVGGDGASVLLSAAAYTPPVAVTVPFPGGVFSNQLFYTNNNGISFTGTKYTSLFVEWTNLYNLPRLPALAAANWPNVWGVAIAPDNPNFWAVVTDNATGNGLATYVKTVGPYQVWVTENAGGTWDITNLALPINESIRTIDISVDYGGRRDIAVGTADGLGGGDVYVIKSTGFTGWMKQNFDIAPLGPLGDFYSVKFSPTYAGDASLAVVYAEGVTAAPAGCADVGATWYNISWRDLDANTHNAWAFMTPIEVRDPVAPAGASPGIAQLNKTDIELPSDFSGQAASLRRAYISLDAWAGAGVAKDCGSRDGIFRIDDNVQYVLMDTWNIIEKSIYSIAYFGTYASGKLLAGERRGAACTATVPTWFTDSPTTCPIPCWYPALKPTTGAAGVACAVNTFGNGGALVGWKADGQLAFAGTGSQVLVPGPAWFAPWNAAAKVALDESAFAISRNNGETWNQIALIDTYINHFSDVAPSADCKTIYLASINNLFPGAGPLLGTCRSFDSVWRTSSNIDVTSPYPPLPVGTFWERIFTHVTAPDCTVNQTEAAILRLVPYCADPTGEIVAWGVYDTNSLFNQGIAFWSPDFGDYWASITVRNSIQDFTFESRTVLYFLSPLGAVQKMPYTGTAWSTMLPDVDPIIYGAHTIAAYPEGKVLVGADAFYHANLYAVSYSSNFNTDTPSFTILSTAGATPTRGNIHVAFDPAFDDNSTIYAADETNAALGAGGSVFRNNPAAQIRWSDADLMSTANGAVGCNAPNDVGQFGIALAFTGSALYSAHTNWPVAPAVNCGVDRTIDNGFGGGGPLSGMPKPGIAWDALDVFVNPPAAPNPCFTLQPSSLKICGCCDLDSDSTLYAIDNAVYSSNARTGLVWAYTDCLAKRGPALITEDATLIGCDPVSGRAQEVNLCWEQLCVADAYDVEVAKNTDFSIKIIDWVGEAACAGLVPVNVTIPCAYIPAGGWTAGGSELAIFGNLECGHTYYWRVKARHCATGSGTTAADTGWVRSPWSEVRSFTVKAGLPVTTPYYGPQLLAPNNGCLGCPISPASFSWSPFKETTKYKFVLAQDAAMTQVVKEAEVTTTAFEYDGTLDYSTNYFWRVMALEPAPSDWSATFSFQTEAAPPEDTGPAPAEPTPLWVWVVIAIGAILVIVTLVLIFKTRRV